MRMRVVGIALAAALAGCGGGEGGRESAAASGQSVDSGPPPTPALDSVGGTANDRGRSD